MNTLELQPEQMPKAIVHWFFEEFLNEGDLAVADQLLSHDFIASDGKDSAALKESMLELRQAFPDLPFTIQDTIIDGSKVVIRWTNEGTDQGTFAGASPTGRQVVNKGISIYRVEEGKIREAWSQVDRLGVLQQIGAVPKIGPVAGTSRTTSPANQTRP
jgi:steroid delta-isomerase-like uncharacterized protein